MYFSAYLKFVLQIESEKIPPQGVRSRGLYLGVAFDGDEVSLDIPEDGLTLCSGWSLFPLVYLTKVKIMAVHMCLHVHIPLSSAAEK